MGLTFSPRTLCSIPGGLKVFQIILSLIAIALLRQYGLEFAQASIFGGSESYRDRQLTGTVAIGSSLIISITLLFGYIFFEASASLVESLFCLAAATMNVAGGALAIETYKDMDHDKENVQAGLGMGAMMILSALVYLIDGVIGTIRFNK